MAGIVTTVFASILAFTAGGLLSTPFTIFDGDSNNQGLAVANGLLFTGVAYYVQLDILLLIAALFAGAIVVGGATEMMR